MTHHGESLRRLTADDALVAQLKVDYTRAELSAKDEAMVAYAATLTCTPAAVQETDVETLRRAGFNDREILDIVQITAYFAFVTRMAHDLGVALEQ